MIICYMRAVVDDKGGKKKKAKEIAQQVVVGFN